MRIDFKSFKYKWKRPDPNQFPTGSRVYKGFQGSGKTLSMVKYAHDVKKVFPKCKIFSNVILNDFDYYLIKNDDDLKFAISCRNGGDGVLVLLDEAHLYFNKKGGIPLDVLTAISQQRKDRRRLVFSSQIWEELDISLRKQVKEIVTCRTLFGFLQYNKVSDGESLSYDKLQGAYVSKKLYSELFKHSLKLYKSYDTYQKIISNSEYNRLPQNVTQTFVVSQTKK